MEQSILKSIKKTLGVDESYDAFDLDIITNINAVLSDLNDLGIGPPAGYAIEDNTAVWDDFIGDDPLLNSVKTYIYLKCRMWFDPPTTSYLLGAYKEQIAQIEWRINVRRENREWVSPVPGDLTGSDLVLDGGDSD